MKTKHLFGIKLRHYTAVALTYALIFGQAVPAYAYTDDQLLSSEDTIIVDETYDSLLTVKGQDSDVLTEEVITNDKLTEESILADDVLPSDTLSETDDLPDILTEASGEIQADGTGMYDFDASLLDLSGNNYPGVYRVTPTANTTGTRKTIGIPSISKTTLAGNPTTESPAIIMGAAVPYETRHYSKEQGIYFTPIEGRQLLAPYSYFRYEFMEEANANGTGVHRKITGYDGTYVIIRVDVSELIKNAPEGSYLHYKQSNNKAIMVKIGQDLAEGMGAFSDAMGTRTGAYQISGNKLVTRDKEGDYKEASFIDIILLSSGTLVQGADTGSAMEDAKSPLADFPLNFYIDQTGDYDPNIEWNDNLGTAVDKNTGKEIVLTQEEIDAKITTKDKMLNKYYDDKKAKTSGESGYTVKGSDIELEIMVENKEGSATESGKTEYWSLKNGMEYDKYNNHALKLMCEAPLLNSLNVTGDKDRHVILDVNSFDIQLANHQDTNAAALIVDGATLKVMDTSNTTGAELAVGNNATMVVKNGGRLIIDETAQLEVEYDSASVSAGEVPAQNPLNNGVLTVNTGGVIENNGVITVEGKEGKPQDAADAASTVRDYRNAILTIDQGGTLENHGCLLVNGELYNLGTIINDGKYNELITSDDPDKGTFTYHRGIQLSWKDDITQGHTNGGEFYNGIDESLKNTVNTALLENTGDILMVPGYMNNYARFDNTGNLYMCAVDEVVIPIKAYADKPLITEKRINLGFDEYSILLNNKDALINNNGTITTAKVEIVNNGCTGNITVPDDKYAKDIFIRGKGAVNNSGTIDIGAVVALGQVTNSGNGIIKNIFLASEQDGTEGSFIDTSSNKGSKVYNGSKTEGTGKNEWTYAGRIELKISDDTRIQNAKPGDTVNWKISVKPRKSGNDILYLIRTYSMNAYEYDDVRDIKAGEELIITSPQMHDISANEVFYFMAESTEEKFFDIQDNTAVVKVSGTGFISPTAMQGAGDNNHLVYNGKEQALVTPGSVAGGKIIYKLADESQYIDSVPMKKDAGTYTVDFKAVDANGTDITGKSGSITVTIDKKDAYISADDKISRINTPQEALTYAAFGFCDSDNVSISVDCAGLNTDSAGSYTITPSYIENANYNVTLYNGSYTVLNTDVDFTASVQSIMTAFDNVSHGVSINYVYKPLVSENKVTVYYSSETELTDSNYSTAGTLAAASFGGLGVKRLYYYITTPDGIGVGGSKNIVVTRAEQQAPDKVQGSASLIGLGGKLMGLVTFNYDHLSMEYRRSDREEYTRAIDTQANVPAGNYLVRWEGDEHFMPSTDTIVTLSENNTVTVTFESNGGSKVADVTGLIYGDLVEKPVDPVKKGYDLVGWFTDKELIDEYNFAKIVTDDSSSYKLYAKWEKSIPGLPDDQYDEFINETGDSLSVNVIRNDDGTLSRNIISISGETISEVIREGNKDNVDSKLWVSDLKEEYAYTGAAIKPDIKVYYGVKKLTEKEDYTLSFKNNKNIGKVGDVKAPTIILKFKGNYKGNRNQNIEFNIVPAPLGTAVEVHDVSTVVLKDNKAQKPMPLMISKDTGKEVKGKSFKITYDGKESVTAPGTYNAIVAADDGTEYSGSVSFNVTVVSDKDMVMSKASVKIGSFRYTGFEILPDYKDITVKLAGQELKANDDYVIESVCNNIKPGTATLVIKAAEGNSKNIAGCKAATFKIVKGRELTFGSGSDFIYEYQDSVPYMKSGARPSVKVYDGDRLLTDKVDYTLTYSKNKSVTNGSKTAVITVKGKGNYKGKVDLPFAIEKQDIKNIYIAAEDQFISKTKYKKPKLSLIDLDGKKLSAKDYRIIGEPYFEGSGDTDIEVTLKLEGTGCYTGLWDISFRLTDKSKDISKAGIMNKIPDQAYTGDLIQLGIDDLKNVLYMGKKDSPKYLNYTDSLETDDFELLAYSNNIKKGTAKVIVHGINGYAGTKTLSFKIVTKPAEYKGVLINGKWRNK